MSRKPSPERNFAVPRARPVPPPAGRPRSRLGTVIGCLLVAAAVFAAQRAFVTERGRPPAPSAPAADAPEPRPVLPHARSGRVAAARPEHEPVAPIAPPLGVALTGRFRDTQRFVAGVSVAVLRLHLDAVLARSPLLPSAAAGSDFVAGTAVTDERGRFTIDGIPPDGLWLLRVEAPGLPAFVELVPGRRGPGDCIDLGIRELPAVRTASVRVIDPLGRGVADAVVRRAPVAWTAPDALGPAGRLLAGWNTAPDADLLALRVPRGIEPFEPPPWLVALRCRIDPAAVRSDPRGRLEWRSVHGKRDRLMVESDGHAPAVVDVTLASDGGAVVEVVLEPLAPCAFEVQTARGAPVASAPVAVAWSAFDEPVVPFVERGVTDEDGRVVVHGPRGVNAWVAATCPESGAWTIARWQAGTLPIVHLPRVHRVGVRATLRGEPLGEFEVRLVPGRLHDEARGGAVQLLQLGALRPLVAGGTPGRSPATFAGVPEGSWLACVSAPGHVPRLVPLEVDRDVDVEVELERHDVAWVELRDRVFEPLRGASVAVEAPFAGALPSVVGRTGREATVRVTRDPGAALAFAVVDPGRGGLVGRLEPGERSTRLELRGRGALAATLRSEREGFEPGSWLLVARRLAPAVVPEPPVLSALDTLGVTRVDDLPPGAWEVSARRFDEPLLAFGAVLDLMWPGPDQDTATVRIPVDVAAGSVASVGFDPWPAPVEAVTMPAGFAGRIRAGVFAELAIDRGGTRRIVPLAADGSFDIGVPPPGEVELVITRRLVGAATELWRKRIELPATAPLDVEIRSVPFHATFLTADGARAAGVEVRLEGTVGTPEGRFELRTRANERGVVDLLALPHGRHRLRITDARHGWLRTALTLDVDRTTVGLRVSLEPFLRVAGRLGTVGVPVPRGSKVELVRDDRDGVLLTRSAVCEEGGDFTVEGLLPGRYRATLHAARRYRRPDGAIVLLMPSASGVVVPLTDVIVTPGAPQPLVLGAR